VHHVVDEVEADCLARGDERRAGELGQREPAVEHPVFGEGGEHGVRRRPVVRDGIGAKTARAPPRQVAVAGGRRGEPVVLRGHVGDEAVQRPVGARRRRGHVTAPRAGHERDAGEHRLRVERHDPVDNRSHMLIIS